MEVMCGGESESESASLLHGVTFVTLIEPYVTDVLKSIQPNNGNESCRAM